jgi:hypothetical protein
MQFDTSDAKAIAKKLNATIVQKSKHDIAQFWHEGKLIGWFGIRRGANGGHDFIPKQLNLSPHQCREFKICHMSLEEVVQVLKEKHIIPSGPQSQAHP